MQKFIFFRSSELIIITQNDISGICLLNIQFLSSYVIVLLAALLLKQ